MKDNKGQALIEFLVVLSFALAIIFLFTVLSLNSGTGYLVHFVNYVGSRVFLTADNSSNQVDNTETYAITQARLATQQYDLEPFGLGSFSEKMQFNRPGDVLTEYVGTWFSFKSRLSIFSTIAGGESAELTTESFLGREPPRIDCLERVCSILDGIYSCSDFATVYDNGC